MNPNLILHHTACEPIEGAQVIFMKKHFSEWSCENADGWTDYPDKRYDGKRLMDVCFEKIRMYGISQFKWVRGKRCGIIQIQKPTP